MEATEISHAINYIRERFDWDDPKLPSVIQYMSAYAITESDLAKILDVSENEIKDQIDKRPRLKMARDMGPIYADMEVTHKLFENAMKGNVSAQQFWLKNRRADHWSDKLKVEVTTKIDLQSVLNQARARALEGVIDGELDPSTGNGSDGHALESRDSEQPLGICQSSVPVGKAGEST